MAKPVMIQGTGSHVGKSILTAALCRIFKEDGINVAPFKSQNMALNSFVTEEGGEMGRAQVVQAEAAGLVPHIHMNPILIKPHADMQAQVIIHGKVKGNYSARDFHGFKKDAMKYVKESYDHLAAQYDLVIIEGAGSPAEINLRENDIANMGTAHLVDAPVILVGDIDKGGVFASLVGTLELLDEADRSRIKGFIINKFRGDISLLKPGLDFLEEKTGLPVLGVIPYFRDIYIQEEDSVNLDNRKRVDESCQNISKEEGRNMEIAVLYLPHISNFTDFDPFASEEDVNVRYVASGEKIGRADLIIIPGSKSTIADLKALKNYGYADEIAAHVDRGGRLVGICGGYQMLGQAISDPQGVEGGGSVEALGYLDIKTVMNREKMTQQVEAVGTKGSIYKEQEKTLRGYEIHMGESFYVNGSRPLFEVTRQGKFTTTVYDGAAAREGRIWGTYMHGIFDNDDFRFAFLEEMRNEKGMASIGSSKSHEAAKEEGFKKLAALVRENLDMKKLYEITGIN